MSADWRWTADTGPVDETFATQADAEAWLAEAYAELEAAGATEVTLLQGDRVVYGPMSLLPG